MIVDWRRAGASSNQHIWSSIVLILLCSVLTNLDNVIFKITLCSWIWKSSIIISVLHPKFEDGHLTFGQRVWWQWIFKQNPLHKKQLFKHTCDPHLWHEEHRIVLLHFNLSLEDTSWRLKLNQQSINQPCIHNTTVVDWAYLQHPLCFWIDSLGCKTVAMTLMRKILDG